MSKRLPPVVSYPNQTSVTLPSYIRAKLYKVAKLEKRSASAICCEAVALYLDNWVSKAKDAKSK